MATLMYTCCPECSTCFRITKAQLDVAQGKVRCGKCTTVFNAKAHLTDALPSKQKPVAAEKTPAPTKPAAPTSKPASPPVSPSAAEADLSASTTDKPPPARKFESDFIDLAADTEKNEAAQPTSPPREELKTPSATPKFIDTTELPDSSGLVDSLFADNDASAEQAEASSRYQYTDISDDLEKDADIDDILEEMNEQLTLVMETPLPDSASRDSELSLEIDNIGELSDEAEEFVDAFDSALEETQTETETDNDDIAAQAEEVDFDIDIDQDDHAIEKAFLQEVEIEHPDALSESADESQSYLEEADSASTPEAKPAMETEAIPLRLRESLQIEPPRKRSIWLTLTGLVFSLLLLVVFAGQLALFRNMELANAYPPLQPWLSQFCNYLPCRYDMQRDVAQIKLLSRDVRAHPKVESALLINAAMVNQAHFKQPYPDLLITLFDLTGNVVAKRRFTPADYMGKLNNPFLLMTPNTPVQIALEVIDPGNNAINFEFEFL